MIDWKLLAIFAPLLFVTYQTLSKVLPKDTPIFLVNAYASLIGFLIMILIHFLVDPKKRLILDPKVLPVAIGIGILISLGNFAIIKAYSLGAPQSLFSSIFYVALIIYGVLFGFIIWHEKLNLIQLIGIFLSIAGLLMVTYFRK